MQSIALRGPDGEPQPGLESQGRAASMPRLAAETQVDGYGEVWTRGRGVHSEGVEAWEGEKSTPSWSLIPRSLESLGTIISMGLPRTYTCSVF